ncbi:MAG: 3-deoxy-7-phosphoheptulonate synthase [Anaerolineales bacterium]|nr:3-deoxy-7-phosphoheptulonate synthase [Anaerolineales bacterium]
MIIVMQANVQAEQIAAVISKVESMGCETHLSSGESRTIIGVIGDSQPGPAEQFEMMPGVEKVLHVLHRFKLSSRDMHPTDTVVTVGGTHIGAGEPVIIAGPCSVESRSQLIETAHAVQEAGASILRGGAFKPRTSPYSFQGLGQAGLELLAEAGEATGLPIVTEALAPDQVPIVTEYADMIQVGARNMQNFPLLRAAGQSGFPVLLKRGMMSTYEEWLMAADYILSQNNPQVVLCERGIRGFETSTRFSTDINAVPAIQEMSHLPILIDPSHSTGKWQYVHAVARAGIAAGADGLIVEVHPKPEEALSDGAQSLKPEQFARLVQQVKALAGKTTLSEMGVL